MSKILIDEATMKLIERLSNEADLCRNEGANDIAALLDDAAKALAEQPAQQEPVAWRYTDARGHYRYRGFVANFDKEYPMLKPQALYTTPQPAQRTWVGLTDDEKQSVCRVGPVHAPDGFVTRNPLEYRKELQGVALMAVRQAEAKLKEKNT